MYELKITFDKLDDLYEFVSAYKEKKEGAVPKVTVLQPSTAVDGAHPGKYQGYHGKHWSSYDDEYIKEHYEAMTYAKIAKSLGRTVAATQIHISQMIQAKKIAPKINKTYKVRIPKGTTINYASDGVHIR